jgi:hypothetical protein
MGDDSGAGDGGGSSSGGDDASGYGMATNPGEDAAIESGVDGANPAGSGGNGDAGVEGGSSGAALCQKLGSCCARIMMISPTSNVQSCVQAAQSGNASLCMSYYGLLTSTGLTALCP